MSRSPASKEADVCIPVMTIMEQFLGQAQEKIISWLLAGETMFETRPTFSGAGLGKPHYLESHMKLWSPVSLFRFSE